MEKKTKGITLIALVITIIVLLILAGVSIATLTGENGILTRASKAREKTEEATEEEQRDLAKLEAKMNLETYNYETDETDESGKKKTVPIPAGFAPTGKKGENKIEDGFVITDSEGNEFVWVPYKVGTDNEKNDVTYETVYSSGNSGAFWIKQIDNKNNNKAYMDMQYLYCNGSATWSDIKGDLNSVKKNGGFYVARYEAGVPEIATFYADGITKTATQEKNVNTYKPVSKKNNQSWNFISQTNALDVSEDMYADNSSVRSQLIDSYAWDTIVEWIKTDNKTEGKVTDSTNYGNYYNNSNIKDFTALHCAWLLNSTSNSWFASSNGQAQYYYGPIIAQNATLKKSDFSKYNYYGWNADSAQDDVEYQIRLELATGATDVTKTKNIYDLAGNMYEWTTETGTNSNNSSNRAVYRGGGFSSLR